MYSEGILLNLLNKGGKVTCHKYQEKLMASLEMLGLLPIRCILMIPTSPKVKLFEIHRRQKTLFRCKITHI